MILGKKKKRKKISGGANLDKSWWEKQKFGGGKQGMLINVEAMNPAFLNGDFTWNEIGFLLTMTFVAWKTRSWEVWTAQPFLEEALARRGNGSPGSIKRFKKKWIDAGFLKRTAYDPENGNDYLIAPLLLSEYEAEKMQNYKEARALLDGGLLRVEEKARQRILEKAEKAKLSHTSQLAWLRAYRDAEIKGLPLPDPATFKKPEKFGGDELA